MVSYTIHVIVIIYWNLKFEAGSICCWAAHPVYGGTEVSRLPKMRRLCTPGHTKKWTVNGHPNRLKDFVFDYLNL